MPETSVLPSTSANPPPARPAADLAFFAPPPLIEGEDTAAYDDLLARISGAIKPSDILEEIWVRDVVDLTWDAFRLRRLKAKLLTATAHEGMAATLRPLVDAPINSPGNGPRATKPPWRPSRPRSPRRASPWTG
jgi:hypothetical protein